MKKRQGRRASQSRELESLEYLNLESCESSRSSICISDINPDEREKLRTFAEEAGNKLDIFKIGVG